MAAHSMSNPVAKEGTNEAADHEDTSVQTLAGNGIQEVPHRFIRSESELASFTPYSTLSLEPIPMIDLEGLQDYRRQFTMAAISSACRHWGCFQVVNHEIPQPVLDDALRAAREFFEMTPKEKQAYNMEMETPHESGYSIQSSESEDKVLDWGDVVFHKNMEKWPAKPATYKSAMVAYARETRKVLEALLDVVSVELRLTPTYFRDLFGDFEQSLRVNYYPSCPQPELVLGLRSHTDPVVFTALLEDQTRGLQVRNGDKWVTVDPEPDALVILVGDQLQIAGNGRCRAVTHRAVVNKDTDRISIVMGLEPNPKVVVRPAPELLEKSSPTRYEGRTYGEFKSTLPHGVRWESRSHGSTVISTPAHLFAVECVMCCFVQMGKPFKQPDSYANTFAANNLVRNALEELINVSDLHRLGPKNSRPVSRKFRSAKPFLPPGNSSKLACARPSQSQSSKRNSSTSTLEGYEDFNLPVCAATAELHAIIDGRVNPSYCGSARTVEDIDMLKLQSRLVIPSLMSAKQHWSQMKKTTGATSSPDSECCRDFSCQVDPQATTDEVSSQVTRPRLRGRSLPSSVGQLEGGWSSVPCKSGHFE